MEHKLNHTAPKVSLVVFAALVSLTAGCGDGFFTKGDGFVGSSLSKHVRDAMGDSEVDVLEYTGCEVAGSSDPEARCEGVSGTQIEVFIDGQSIIFDFSNVTKDGQISEADFEGYVVSVTEDSNLPPILEAILDAAKSTVDSKDIDVEFDDKNIAVNLQGLDYDDATFVKIDLVFEDATAVGLTS
jgi:hypothetical protein